ncbi:B12-binding domain-containing radical SAM protein [Bradyrhizobium sp.]|uniref:B12-binding domain-containing radical SAM protein n=1 Tax=Bradyrhizobium sp. TaxID=376 RepID=UPI003C5834D0
MKNTLLLVMPPQLGLLEGFSSGLIALGNYIKLHNEDTSVRLLDLAEVAPGDTSKCVQAALQGLSGTVFAGITGTTAGYQSMLSTAQAFKQCSSGVITVFGGPHATAQDEIILDRHRFVDFVVRGEGEIALSSLLRHHGEPERVPSLSFRDGGRIVKTEDAPALDPAILDLLDPFPTFPGELSSPPGKFDHVTYVSARGCPLKCDFCVVRNSAIRTKSVPAVIEDLRHLVGQRGYKRIAIEDNFFAHRPKRTLELCAAIAQLQKEMDFNWDCQTRVESMRRSDVLAAMAKANCDKVFLGVEALVPAQLQFLGKTQRPEKYLECLSVEVAPQILSAGIGLEINLQLGIPGEDESQRTATLLELSRLGRIAADYGRRIVVSPQLHVVYPGTPHSQTHVANGGFGTLGNAAFEEFTAWEAEHQPVLTFFGEHFAHGNGGIPIGILDRGGLSRSEFLIDDASIGNLSSQLAAMEGIEGISVRKYGEYLTRTAQVGESGGKAGACSRAA